MKVVLQVGKKSHELEVDVGDTLEVLQFQIFSLTDVPPENQKIIYRGKMIKAGEDIGALGLEEGAKMMMLNSGTLSGRTVTPFVNNNNNNNNYNNNSNINRALNSLHQSTTTNITTTNTKTATATTIATTTSQATTAAAATTSTPRIPSLLSSLSCLASEESSTPCRLPPPPAAAAAVPVSNPLVDHFDPNEFVFEEDLEVVDTECTRIHLGNAELRQPLLYFNSGAGGGGGFQIPVCVACATTCRSATPLSVRPAAESRMCECAQNGECLFSSRIGRGPLAAGNLRAALVRLLSSRADARQAEQARQAQIQANGVIEANKAAFTARCANHLETVKQCENSALQAQARAVIPISILETRARENPSAKPCFRDEMVCQLLFWFKKEFFKWVNSPPCQFCEGECESFASGVPTADDLAYGASRVELHKCKTCGRTTRFPRYNHAGKLLETRRGRCGEWAQAFTLCVRALGYEARFVSDWTDHVWTEYYSEHAKKWVHCDPCENIFDAPFTYEVGWNKKLNYIIAFSGDEVVDVTKRYTHKFSSLERTLVPEDWLSAFVARQHSLAGARVSMARRAILDARRIAENHEFEHNQVEVRELVPEELRSRISGNE